MPTYRVRDKERGISLKVRGDSEPTEQEAQQLIEQEAAKRGMMGADRLPQSDEAPDQAVPGLGPGSQQFAEGLPEGESRPITAREAMPDQDFLDRAGTSLKLATQQMTTMDPERFMNLYREEFPGARFERTDDGKIIADFTEVGGKRGVIDNMSKEGIAGAAVQFSPAGQFAQKGRLLWQMLKGGGASGVTEGIRDVASQAFGGEEEVSAENVNAGSVGAATAGGVAGPALARGIQKAVQKFVPGTRGTQVVGEDGQITDDAMQKIQKANTDPKQLDRNLARELRRENVLGPDEAERFNLFQGQGVRPTRANLTQSADDFQFQQEQFKTSSPVRRAVDAQDQDLVESTRRAAERTGGQTAGERDTGQQVFRAVTRKAEDLDNRIGELYDQARQAAGPGKNVRFDSLTQALRRNAGKNEVSGGVVRALRSELRQRGLIGQQGFKPQGRVSVEQAEDLRQSLNSLYEGANPQGRRILNQAKQALDDDVFRQAGDDVFKEARRARANFSKEFKNAVRSKFDKNTGTVLEDILEGKVEPERLPEKLVLNKSGSVRDLQALRRYLTTGTDEQVEQGQQAWNALRRSTIEDMLDRATDTAGKTEGGNVVFNGNRFRKQLERVGDDRLRTLFSADEIKDLGNLRKVGELRIPVSGTQQGRGPTAQAIEQLTEGSKTRQIGDVVRTFFGGRSEARQAAEAADPIRETLRAFERAQTPAGAAPGAAGGVIATQ